MNSSDALTQLNNKFRKDVMPVTVFVGVEALVGFIGNLLVIFVFSLRYRTCNFKYFVLFLAITDITSCLTTVPGEILTQLNWYNYPYPIVCKIKSFFNMFTVCCEDLCLLVIAIDRYRKVCKPTGRQIQPRMAMYLCCGIYVVSIVLSVPVGIFWGTHNANINTSHGIINTSDGIMVNATICEIDEEFLEKPHKYIYSICIETLLSSTLIVMFGLYVCIAKTLSSGFKNGADQKRARDSSNSVALHRRSSSFNRDRRTSNNDDDCSNTNNPPQSNNAREVNGRTFRRRVLQKTRIMFILTVVFIVTTIIYLTLLLKIADGILVDMENYKKVVYFFFFRLYFVNHVINPIVYGCLDKTFQDVVRSCWKKTKFELNTRHSGSLDITTD